MPKNANIDYSALPSGLRQVYWRVDMVEDCLEKEINERKETDKDMFNKFDKLNSMIIYQLCAAVLTLIAIIAVYIKG